MRSAAPGRDADEGMTHPLARSDFTLIYISAQSFAVHKVSLCPTSSRCPTVERPSAPSVLLSRPMYTPDPISSHSAEL